MIKSRIPVVAVLIISLSGFFLFDRSVASLGGILGLILLGPWVASQGRTDRM